MNFFYSLFLLAILLPQFSNYPQTLFNEEPLVRVRIIYSLDSLNITFNSEWKLYDSINKISLDFFESDSISLSISDNLIILKNTKPESSITLNKISLKNFLESGTLIIKNVPYGIGWWWEGNEDRVYEGDFDIYINADKKFDVIITLPLEKYLCGVVPYEIGSDAPPEALKAQVIAARSETVEALITKKYTGDNFDLCADVECQVFAGNNKRTAITDQAVYDTRGLCLFYGDDVIGAYYASNCGGISENVENVWPERSGSVPYWSSHFDSDKELPFNPQSNPEEWIESNPDVYCNPYFHPDLPSWSKNNFRWQVEMTVKELTANINEIKNIGVVKDIIPVERGKSGRIIKAKFIGDVDSLILNSELEIRKIKKPPFRSSCFIVDKIISSDGNDKFLFKGAGWGHGVGMCQSGAVARAYSGQTFTEILNHYFQSTEIKKVY